MSRPPAIARSRQDAAWAAQARQLRSAQDDALGEAFLREAPIDDLLAQRAQQVDVQVLQAWQHCLGEAPELALFAVGGYGRGVLYPQSDIDLLVLAEETVQARHGEAIARFVALLWDAGLPASHAVRSLAQCVQACAQDITALTAVMEARALSADADVVEALHGAITVQAMWPAPVYFAGKREEQRQRHARFGNTSDNLEPNIKDGPGGLRDVDTLRWIAQRVLGARDLQALIATGQLGADEHATLQRERRVLSRLRWGLHTVARKREERLRFDHQKTLAEHLGHVDGAHGLAVETMMQGFYRAAGLIRRINDRLLQRFEDSLDGEADDMPLAAGYVQRRGYLRATDPHWPADAQAIFAFFAQWAAHPQLRGIESYTARALAEALPRVPAWSDADDATRAAFIALVRGPRGVKTVERMARLGVLARWIPAFARVTGRMQFDLFHVYTVDQHTLMVLRNIRHFAQGTDERFSIAHRIHPQLRKPELLLLAGLFHDIAKGRGGDHSVLGAEDAQAFCRGHGLPASEVDTVAWLVREHLLMSVTAQKQDIGDPQVIHAFATRVADRERLDLLYLLTCADIAGTSPKLWNAWKDRLLADLHTATRLALRRGLEHPIAAAERIEENRANARAALLAEGHAPQDVDDALAGLPDEAWLRGRPESLQWQAAQLIGSELQALVVAARTLDAQAGALEVLVRSPDRDGLFAAITATFDRLGLAVQQARLLDAPADTVVDTFEAVPSDPGRPVTPEVVRQRLQQALAQPRLDAIRPSRRTQPRHLQHFRIGTQIEITLTEAGRSLLSLVTTDRPGLLADVTGALRDAGVRVHDARIATFGERAEDLFLITDHDDQPLSADHAQALRQALLDALEGTTA